eukprot:snap_masked-scaffold_34-processed-gene-3.46-mRNA-1 protein AED:1.00 eAED:1.00 QI:0/-1/0/0/-1/1/1/0/276
MFSLLKYCLPFIGSSKKAAANVSQGQKESTNAISVGLKGTKVIREKQLEAKVQKVNLSSESKQPISSSLATPVKLKKRGHWDTRNEYLAHVPEKSFKRSPTIGDGKGDDNKLCKNIDIWAPSGTLDIESWDYSKKLDVSELILCPTFAFSSKLLPIFYAVDRLQQKEATVDISAFGYLKLRIEPEETRFYGYQDLDELEAEGLRLLEEENWKVKYESIYSLEIEAMQYLEGTEIIRPIPKTSIKTRIECSLLDAEEDRLYKLSEERKQRYRATKYV